MCYGACQAVVLCHNAETFLQRGFPAPGSHSLVQIVYYRKAGILSLLMAAVIAFSRLYFFVHYPTDILGGMVLGTLDAVLAVYIVKRLEDRADAI